MTELIKSLTDLWSAVSDNPTLAVYISSLMVVSLALYVVLKIVQKSE